MPDLDVALPDGTRLVSLAERPDLRGPMSDHNVSVWPAFMLEDPISDRLWHHLGDDWAAFQLCLLASDGAILAAQNASPLDWDGTDAGLPAGWDDQFERAARDCVEGVAATALGAVQIVVVPAQQGTGLAGVMLDAMRANAKAHGLDSVIACVRPTWKPRYPLAPIERYAGWTRDDGMPFDPWIRLHVRAGGRIVRAAPRSMTVTGSVSDWEAWTGMAFPETGQYVVPGACTPVSIDREQDRGTYYDPNVWIVHDLR